MRLRPADYAGRVEAHEDRFVWARRLRWRLRGAWQAPAFVLFTLLDAAVLQAWPFAGDRGPGIVATLILAGFLNLVVVAVVGPLTGIWLRRRHAGMPAFAARDRGSVLALAGMCALLAAGGLAHRPAVRGESRELGIQAAAARAYFHLQAPPAYRRNLTRMTTWKAGPHLYRTCLPGPDPAKHLCVYVTTDQSPAGVTRDRSQEPNAVVAGPGETVLRIR